MMKAATRISLCRLISCLLVLLLDLRYFSANAFQFVPPSSPTKNLHPLSLRTNPSHASHSTSTSSALFARGRAQAQKSKQNYQVTLPPKEDLDDTKWFPRKSIPKVVDDDDIFGNAANDNPAQDDEDDDQIEVRGVQLLARLLSQRIGDLKKEAEQENNPANDIDDDATTTHNNKEKTLTGTKLRNYELAKGRFIDLACSEEGEKILEDLFRMGDAAKEKDPRVVQAAVMALQSICVLGTQVGVKGSPVQLQRMIAHLDSRGRLEEFRLRDLETWDTDSVRRLKHRLSKGPGIQVLAQMQWRRTTQGAFEVLVAAGAWGPHEDLPLLRSGFSVRFNGEELEAAETASQSTRDPDETLGLRKDLRHMKVFTIDSAETSEIDDGISLEKYTDDSGTERQRIWIHIADAERWAPRNSGLFDVARRRVTSLYLPQGPIPMLPPKANDEVMSLTMGKDSHALSLRVELNEDGSIDESNIMVTPSLIRVSYRLTYDEVDEMLEEGIGYSEEWELGGLLAHATHRRNYRINRGSSEGFVPNPIPQKTISISADADEPGGIRVEVNVQATHNSGSNQTAGAETTSEHSAYAAEVEPVSSAFTLVTESMILAGEAIGRWKVLQDKLWDKKETESGYRNEVRLPFRTQRKPDYTSRSRERNLMNSLAEYNVGGGYCHAWYCRRFLSPVKVQETCAPHSGLGLSAYVQWTSPIRRYSDLVVHNSVKRYLRRQRIHELLSEGKSIEGLDLVADDIGCPLPQASSSVENDPAWDALVVDMDIDFREGGGLMGAARMLQRQSEQYWLYEYIRRIHESDPDKRWDALVLGYVDGPDKSKKQYAIYIYGLGFEHKISSRSISSKALY